MTRAAWMIWDAEKKQFLNWWLYRSKNDAARDCHTAKDIVIRVVVEFTKPKVKP